MRTCSITDCSAVHYAKDLCYKHWRRQRTHGDPLIVHRAPNGTGYITKNGYRTVKIGNVGHLEHRLVFARHIGRPLLTSENIHHINHDKLDNRIENLCIMTKSAHAKEHARDFHPNPAQFTATEKRCSRCKIVKPLSDFYKRRKRRNNPSSACINCVRFYRALQRSRTPKRGVRKGATHTRAKNLNIALIQTMHSDGLSQRRIAKHFNVSQTLIARVIHGAHWSQRTAN